MARAKRVASIENRFKSLKTKDDFLSVREGPKSMTGLFDGRQPTAARNLLAARRHVHVGFDETQTRFAKGARQG
jgi:hypothetical protein